MTDSRTCVIINYAGQTKLMAGNSFTGKITLVGKSLYIYSVFQSWQTKKNVCCGFLTLQMCLSGAFNNILSVNSSQWKLINTINRFPVQQLSPVWMTFNICLFLSMCSPFRHLTSSQFQVPITSFEGSNKLKDFLFVSQ